MTPDRQAILNLGGGEDFQDKGQKGWGFQDDLTFTSFDWHGAHTVKTGFKYKSVEINAFEQQPFNPQFLFDITTGPGRYRSWCSSARRSRGCRRAT